MGSYSMPVLFIIDTVKMNFEEPAKNMVLFLFIFDLAFRLFAVVQLTGLHNSSLKSNVGVDSVVVGHIAAAQVV